MEHGVVPAATRARACQDARGNQRRLTTCMVPPWPPGSGDALSPAPAPCRLVHCLPDGAHPDPPNKLQNDIYSSQPVRQDQTDYSGLFQVKAGQVHSHTHNRHRAAVAHGSGRARRPRRACGAGGCAGVPLAFFDARTSRLPNVVTLLALSGQPGTARRGGPGLLAGGAERFAHALIGMAVAVAFFGLAPAGVARGHRHGRREAGRAARRLPGLAGRDRVRGRAGGRVAASRR